MEDSEELHPVIRGLTTVCRCNNIKYRTIERAIRDGARTMTAIAERTTATTGHCGGSCTPDVQNMLCELSCALPPPRPQQNAAANNAGAWWVKK
jgi:NAD(P)H-nitrite reductase large subunit